jgi:hypothetical protein
VYHPEYDGFAPDSWQVVINAHESARLELAGAVDGAPSTIVDIQLRSPVSLRCVKNCWLLSKTWRSSMVSSTMASLAIALRGSSENRRCAHNLGREENAGFSAASAAGRIRTRVRQVCWI